MTEEAKQVPIKESRTRSVLKAFTWRILATLTTMTIAWIITGQVGDALKIGGIEFFAKMFIYYGHERAWSMVPYGYYLLICPRRRFLLVHCWGCTKNTLRY